MATHLEEFQGLLSELIAHIRYIADNVYEGEMPTGLPEITPIRAFVIFTTLQARCTEDTLKTARESLHKQKPHELKGEVIKLAGKVLENADKIISDEQCEMLVQILTEIISLLLGSYTNM